MFSDHNEIKLETDKQIIPGKFQIFLKLHNTLPNNTWI